MLYDCFTFFDELDLLELRLHTMDEITDYFVLVEGTKTFTNQDKPLYFYANKSRFERFLPKIIYHCVMDYPKYTTPWLYENFQRNSISDVLSIRSLSSSDTIILSDLDEIPNPDALRPYIGKPGIFQFTLSQHTFYLNHREATPWNAGMLASYDVFSSCLDGVDYPDMVYVEPRCSYTTPTKIRMLKGNPNIPVIQNAGWHFHGLGGAEATRKKVLSTSFLYEPTAQSQQVSSYLLGNQVDKYDPECFDVIDERYPRYLRENKLRFAHHIHPGPYLD